ncbi:MAG: ABC transporter ATP-binding protein [Proteobacteria bacterium]|nr:ABC transporter ATP-binding protein [Pseudomonadota bacterium]
MMDGGDVSQDNTRKAAGAERGHIVIRDMSVIFGEGPDQFIAVDRVSVDIAAGEFLCIVGPSGCGKSTVMNAIAGFEFPTEGSVTLDGAPIEGPGADRGMVFQQPTLFPWKNVRANVAHGPRMHGRSDAEANSIADGLLEMVGLSAFAESRPQTLSGGMQQRTAIARALANTPSVLLMDEPFGALDAQTRLMMQESLLQIWSEVRPTVVFVTHDIDEAIFLADRIVVMSASPGRIIREITVDLSRPRAAEMTLDASFVALKRQCMDLIRTESLRAFEQQTRGASRD